MYQLSQGGMGTVFLGTFEDGSRGSRPVAIKRIHPHLARNRALVEMFLDEANIASRIDHPNVCKLIDFGQVDGVLYIAMEYLAGVPMGRLSKVVSERDEIFRSRQWHALAAKIAAEAALGLHAAHELTDDKGENLGTVHRDVSPQNVFVTFEGAVKLLDFGIVFARNRFHQTKDLSLKGKLSYMAPEQLLRVELDRRADIWALGVCLWEMLAGRRLNAEQDLMKSLDTLLDEHRSVPPPSEFCTEISQELDQIVDHALSWDRNKRYATGQELGEALTTFVTSAGYPTGSLELSKLLMELFTVEHEQEVEIVKTVITAAKTVEIIREQPQKHIEGAADASDSDRKGKSIPITTPIGQPMVQALAAKPVVQEDDYRTIVQPRLSIEDTSPWRGLERPTDESMNSDGAMPRAATSIEAPTDTKRSSTWPRLFLFIPLGLALFALGSLTTILFFRGSPPDREPFRDSDEELLSGFLPPTTNPPPFENQRDASAEAFETHDGGRNGQLSLPNSIPTSPDVEASSDSGPEDSGVAPNLGDADEAASPIHDAAAVPPRDRERTPTRVKTKQAVRFGQVNVVTVGGWANVSERGRSLGMTPTRLRLREGRHVITLHPFGRSPTKQVVVNIEANKTVRVVVPVGR